MDMDTKEADREFSILIRKRDPMCKKCHVKPSTDCSHFYERHNSSVRFHPENCDGMCRACHEGFHRNRPEYKAWKLKQLGVKAYFALQRLSVMVMKREDAILKFKNTLKK